MVDTVKANSRQKGGFGLPIWLQLICILATIAFIVLSIYVLVKWIKDWRKCGKESFASRFGERFKLYDGQTSGGTDIKDEQSYLNSYIHTTLGLPADAKTG